MPTSTPLLMPFGKYRDVPVEEVPPDYLAYALAHWSFDRRPWLRRAIAARLAAAYGPGAPDAPEAPGDPGRVRDLVRRWYREMSTRYHPDRGGSDAAMAVVNECRDRLVALLGRLGEDAP